MRKKFIVNVTIKDREEIQDICERVNSLKVLQNLLDFENTLYDVDKVAYEKIKKDWEYTSNKFNISWSNLIRKYNLDMQLLSQYYLDFSTNSIYI